MRTEGELLARLKLLGWKDPRDPEPHTDGMSHYILEPIAQCRWGVLSRRYLNESHPSPKPLTYHFLWYSTPDHWDKDARIHEHILEFNKITVRYILQKMTEMESDPNATLS